MGAYLSEPVVEKITGDEKNDKLRLSYGASSMQGWRVSQEDAHNTILDFDTDTSFFAVYDGHGGHEVATYCALNLPDFIKNLDVYKEGDLVKALEEGYLEFDQTLTKEDVIKALHVIAGNKSKDASSEEDPDEMNELYEEATMSIEELLMKYGTKKKALDEEGESQSKSSHMEYLVSKLCAKARKSKNSSEASTTNEETKSTEDEQKDESDGGAASKAKAKNASNKETPPADGTKSENGEHKSQDTENGTKPESNDHAEKDAPRSTENGSLQNGSGDHSSDSAKVPTRGKGKGVGKGLSNTIRKPVEKTAEELEQERKDAEKQAKRKERKESLRKKSGDELYRAMVSNEGEEDDDSDMDDEEDVDFDGESDSDEAEGGDDDEDEWEDMEEEEEEEEEEVAAKARNFTMNLKEEPGSDSGCTAVVALLRGNTLHVANAGDSRCVLSRSGEAIPLSADHKPEDEPERSRIQGAGGVVTADGRVNGGLNLSRAIGDHAYKQNKSLGPREQMITALPDIQTIELEQGDDFFVLACDGIWNSKTNQEVVDFVRARLEKTDCLSQICNELFDECLAPDTRGDGTGCDNMTAIIVRLDRFRPTGEKKETTSTSSLKRAHSEEKSAESLPEEKEGEASHKSKKQRMEESENQESTTSPNAEAASS